MAASLAVATTLATLRFGCLHLLLDSFQSTRKCFHYCPKQAILLLF